jgi:FKBP-type peptidyl-prolyl cis-trans isomerase
MKYWIAALSALLLAPGSAFAVSAELSIQANDTFLAANAHKPGVQVMRDGLQYRVIKAGFGESPKDGDIATVNYSLKLINGDDIEGTEPDFPAQFPVNKLIVGWREALKAMRVGDHWQVFVPSSLGYGPSGAKDGTIPPNQTLVFDIELLKVFTPPEAPKKDDDSGSSQQQQ